MKEKKRVFSPPRIEPNAPYVYDVETNGVNWKTCHIVGIVVCFGPRLDDSFYFPIRHGGGGNFNEQQVLTWMRKLASEPKHKLIGHNFKFDMHMSANDEIHFATRDINCTMVMASLIDENAGSYNMAACAKRFNVDVKADQPMYKYLAETFGGEPVKDQMANYWKLRGDDVMGRRYARQDGSTNFQLYEAMMPYIEQQELTTIHNLEKRVTRTLFRMERHGVKIDEEGAHRVKNQLRQELKKVQRKLPKDFNERSPKMVRAWMEKHDETNWPLTAPSKKFPKGQPSFKEEFMSLSTAGKVVVSLRKTSNMLNSFIDPLLERHMHKGRIHTNFNQIKQDDFGVVSGRLSSNEPNMQQVPKRDKVLGALVRSVFMPDDNCYWSSNDYSQQELVLFTVYSRCALLVKGYSANPIIDGHSVVAQMLTVERDPTAKRLNLGQLYGMGVPALAGHLGVDHTRAAFLNRQYNLMFPEAKQFSKRAMGTARSRGYIKTILGRRRRFPGGQGAHKAMNSIIQGSCADITKEKMCLVDEYFERKGDLCCLQLQIHDDLTWSNPYTSREMDVEAKRLMEDFSKESGLYLSIPVRVDHTEGRSWGEATYGGLNYMEKTGKWVKGDKN